MTKSKFKTELYWFLIVIAISIVLFIALYGKESFHEEIGFEFSFYDTYFVMDSFSLYFYLLSLLLFLVYTVRMVIHRFNNIVTNIGFLLSAVFFSYKLTAVLTVIVALTVSSDFTIYPPLSGLGPHKVEGNNFETLFYVISAFRLLIIAFIIAIGIRTGLKINKEIQNKPI